MVVVYSRQIDDFFLFIPHVDFSVGLIRRDYCNFIAVFEKILFLKFSWLFQLFHDDLKIAAEFSQKLKNSFIQKLLLQFFFLCFLGLVHL